MSAEERLKVEEGNLVNEATLKLLRMEIEGEVKRRFFAWIGAPIGLLGIVSIVYVLFSYIPNHLGKIMEDDLRIRDAIRTSVMEYLKDEDTGKKFIRHQVDTAAEVHINTSVDDYIKSDIFQQELQLSIKKQTMEYYGQDEGAQQVKELVEAQMQSESVRSQIKDAVDAALRPAIARLGNKLKANRDALVIDLPSLGRWSQVRKADMRGLNRFLNENAERLLKSEAPVVLSVLIGNSTYHPTMFEAYHRKLRERLGNQFRYVHIADTNGKFLGLVPVDSFMQALAEDNNLLELIRGIDTRSMSEYMKRKFGNDVQKRVSINKEVREVLKDEVLWGTVHPNKYLPVVKNDRLDGLTNREKLINGLLG